ncbi:MAG TPA: potassium-transporting ATPase subunit C [Phycisphaerae bacterium]|nr:potassium-transporting ATPase subunit C [Phycisphaerae bacterium]
MSNSARVIFDLLGELMGQPYDDPRYFWGRPTVPRETSSPDDEAMSKRKEPGSASQRRLQLRRAALRNNGDSQPEAIPAELTDVIAGRFTPFISLPTAAYQVARVARARGVEPEVLRKLIETHAERAPTGEKRINVLCLNAALDDICTPISDNDPHRSEMGLHRMTTSE